MGLSGTGGHAREMRLGQVALNIRPLLGSLGQKVNVHLIGPELRTLMAKVGKVKRDRVVLGLAEGKRRPGAVVLAADEDVIGPGKRGAADQGVDAVEIPASRGAAPIMERLVEASLCTNKGGLITRPPMGYFGLENI